MPLRSGAIESERDIADAAMRSYDVICCVLGGERCANIVRRTFLFCETAARGQRGSVIAAKDGVEECISHFFDDSYRIPCRPLAIVRESWLNGLPIKGYFPSTAFSASMAWL